ncbi:MAG: hypothetical protein ABIQ30_12095 [Devosia sp.]
MRKTSLDHLLENAVAKALGVSMPRQARRIRTRKPLHPVKHAA